ncbi:MAG: polysaccharide biosynthesis/export family protein [Ferruginibacter sp.]|nr:polysaccharide biosynthesis/export family protein [Cytophagales bacterium]
MVYIPNPAFNTGSATNVANIQPEYQLQPKDVLSIRIKTLDPKTSDLFNLQSNTGFQPFDPPALFINGYSLDDEGDVTLPEIGKVNVRNLTIKEAEQKIQAKTGEYLGNATVLVKLVNFKVTVLGEVQRPGYFYVYNERVTLLEALGQAGDLTDFGERKNITLVRQVKGGSEAILINLQDPNLLASKYYYLMPNDVLYVQPAKAKLDRGNLNLLGFLGLFLSTITSGILIYQVFK